MMGCKGVSLAKFSRGKDLNVKRYATPRMKTVYIKLMLYNTKLSSPKL